MSQRITISIPTPSGDRSFYLSKKGLITSGLVAAGLLSFSLLSGSALLYLYTQKHQLESALIKQQTQVTYLTQLNSEQQDETHALSQELETKRNQLQLLGRRVYDVESVLGLASDSQPEDEDSLEQRLDAAAIDSAVRATLFRMIPNDTPLNYNRVSSEFGSRINPISGKRHTHAGIDLTCNMGEAVYAPADGVVESARPSAQGYGHYLTLQHAFGFSSSYAHLKAFKVRAGQFVSKGDLIAECGNSGNSTGPHLHYEVRFLGRPINPHNLISWTPENFESLFKAEKHVKWASLVDQVNQVVKLQVALTQHPYPNESVRTASNDERRDANSPSPH